MWIWAQWGGRQPAGRPGSFSNLQISRIRPVRSWTVNHCQSLLAVLAQAAGDNCLIAVVGMTVGGDWKQKDSPPPCFRHALRLTGAEVDLSSCTYSVVGLSRRWRAYVTPLEFFRKPSSKSVSAQSTANFSQPLQLFTTKKWAQDQKDTIIVSVHLEGGAVGLALLK